MKKSNILISACLCGFDCRYNGKGVICSEFDKLKDRYHLIPVCPEILGGLTTPRSPAEICGKRVITVDGEDVTSAFLRGAEECLHAASRFDCRIAVLKERSPSCGCGQVYDGSFSGKLVSGDGITAGLLKNSGIYILTVNSIQEFFMED